MNQRTSNKRDKGTAGVKVLIATASVAATIAGWALLPANDPAPANAADQNSQQPAVTAPAPAPSTNDNGSNGFSQAPGFQTQPSVPQQDPNQTFPSFGNQGGGFSNWPMPITRSHSSR